MTAKIHPVKNVFVIHRLLLRGSGEISAAVVDQGPGRPAHSLTSVIDRNVNAPGQVSATISDAFNLPRFFDRVRIESPATKIIAMDLQERPTAGWFPESPTRFAFLARQDRLPSAKEFLRRAERNPEANQGGNDAMPFALPARKETAPDIEP
jgi:hypothetical protein